MEKDRQERIDKRTEIMMGLAARRDVEKAAAAERQEELRILRKMAEFIEKETSSKTLRKVGAWETCVWKPKGV
jgi:hypothetical protein